MARGADNRLPRGDADEEVEKPNFVFCRKESVFFCFVLFRFLFLFLLL